MVTAMIAAPLLLTALVTGLVIGMLQAATQINEATLSFIPKLLVLVLALFVTGPWILRVLIDFTRDSVLEHSGDDRLSRDAARPDQRLGHLAVGAPHVVAGAAHRRVRAERRRSRASPPFPRR